MSGKFITFIGFPASGKTTIRKELVEKKKVDEVISPDEIRFYEFGVQFDPALEPLVWSVVKARLGRCLGEGKKCLLDCTNTDSARRKELLAIADDFEAETKAIVMNIDFDVARVRNRRSPISTNGTVVNQTVPDYAMFRMKQEWDASKLGNTKESITKALLGDWDEVEIVDRLADEKDCEELNGRIVSLSNGRKACSVKYEDDLSTSTKNYIMKKIRETSR